MQVLHARLLQAPAAARRRRARLPLRRTGRSACHVMVRHGMSWYAIWYAVVVYGMVWNVTHLSVEQVRVSCNRM